MLKKIAAVLREHCLIDAPATIVVGVSGGPDSLCLMHALHRIGCRVIVSHLDHQLRPTSGEEAREVEAVAAQLSLPCVVQRADARSHARQRRLSVEDAGRQLRYAFLFEQARAHQARAVAVGHTADDQVETVLMHLLRGAGLNGLRGMSYRTLLTEFDPSIPLIRPLLDLWREETVAYCAAKGLRPSTDSSNVSPEFLRNRLRHELIPALEIYNPRAREAIWRAARNLAADRALLAEHLAAEFELLTVGKTRNYVALNAPRLATLSSGMRLHVVRLAVEHLRPGQETTSAMLDPAARFLIDASSVRHDLGGGLMLLREGEILYASRGEDSLPRGAWPQMPPGADSIPVAIPGCLDLAEGWKFAVESSAPPKVGPTEIGVDDHGWKAWLDSESLPERLELRGRRRGDRFEPLGMRGHTQKVSDFFVNAKVPSRARGRWPLLCAGDVVVWIPGYRMAERFKIRPETRQAVCFSVSRTG